MPAEACGACQALLEEVAVPDAKHQLAVGAVGARRGRDHKLERLIEGWFLARGQLRLLLLSALHSLHARRHKAAIAGAHVKRPFGGRLQTPVRLEKAQCMQARAMVLEQTTRTQL